MRGVSHGEGRLDVRRRLRDGNPIRHDLFDQHHARSGDRHGTWSEAAFARAMHEGVSRDGSHLFPVFSFDHFTKLSDEHVRALYAYFMTRSPVHAPARPNGIPLPFNIRYLQAGWKLLFFRSGRFEPDGEKSAEWNRGAYLAEVGGAKRQAAVLKRAAEKAGWGAAVPKDTGLGVATTFGQERGMPTWVACVARVRVDRRSGAVVVEKLTIVVDAGTVVHPDGALAQVEGSALWGLSMALYEGTEFVKGQVIDTNFDSYTLLRIGDVPELDIEFIDSTEAPVGLGEPGTTVVAPAIGNAIFAAVGVRLRHLPIRPAAVLEALTSH